MARIVLGGLTTLNLATHLDAQFVDLYGLRELISSPGYTATNPRMTIGSAGEIGFGGAPISYGGSIVNVDINSTMQPALNLNIAGVRQSLFTVNATECSIGTVVNKPFLFYLNNVLRFGMNTSGVFYPAGDNSQTLGAAGNRWSVVYAGTGTINTSDAREKSKVSPLEDSEIAASIALGKEIGAFKFLASMKEKGESARIHIGMTVQRAIEIMSAHGLDPMAYAFICHDAWAASEVPEQTEHRDTGLKNSSGEPLMETVVTREAYTKPAGDKYGFRPDQLALFILRGIEHRLTQLEAMA